MNESKGVRVEDAKRWLQRAWKVDQEITALLSARDRTRGRAQSITASAEGLTVTATKDPHVFDRLVVLDGEIDARIDELVETKREIIELIGKLENGRHRTLLTLRYVSFCAWEQIAVDMHYTFRNVIFLHKRALEAVARELETGKKI